MMVGGMLLLASRVAIGAESGPGERGKGGFWLVAAGRAEYLVDSMKGHRLHTPREVQVRKANGNMITNLSCTA